MPTWGEILKELSITGEKLKAPPFDAIRRLYLAKLHEHTRNNIILYATNWTMPKSPVSSDLLSINIGDVQGFMEVINGLKGDKLDIILHSPGGSPEATEAIVNYLRTKFSYVRVIIPHAAMSAATMLACSADEIVMGKHSYIGPIDPQMLVPSRHGIQAIPAHAIVEQFQIAKKDCKEDPSNLGVWLPIIEQYGPALLVQCKNAIELSKALVKTWLKAFMFKKEPDMQKKAGRIALQLAKHTNFLSHGRFISRDQAQTKFSLRITNLEADQQLQDLVLSVYHATTHTFNGTSAVKIIENHTGKAFIRKSDQILVPIPMNVPVPPQPEEETKKK